MSGRGFVTEQGRWQWRGISAFKLLALSESEQDAYLQWCAENGVTIVRLFTRCKNLFLLPPEVGLARLADCAACAARHGIYLEVVALVDTADAADDLGRHLSDVADECDQLVNTFLEGANEPRHPTQSSRVPDIIKSFNSVDFAAYAQGAAHGEDDESKEFTGGDAVTVHFNRKDSAWNEVRHRREGELIAGEFNKPVIDDEPVGAAESFIEGKRDNHLGRWFARGVLNRILRLGATFHYEQGLQAQIPSGRQLDCFRRWMDGLNTIPADFWGEFRNATWAGSPVGQFDESKALRIYSAVEGDKGYSITLNDTGVQVPWQNDWRPVGVVGQDDGTRVWEIAR